MLKIKNRILLVAFTATILSLNISFAQHEAPTRSEYCPVIADLSTTPYIDGVADEASWSAESVIMEMFNSSGWDETSTDLSGYIKYCCDFTNLYLFANVTDDVAINYDGSSVNTCEQDNIEVFLDLDTTITNADGSYIGDEIQCRYNRGWNEYTGSAARNGASMGEFVQVDGEGSWQVEAKIPWRAFMPEGITPEDICDLLYINGGAFGFDVSFADNDTELGSNRDAQMVWDADKEGAGATEDNAWKDTRVFGTLVITGSPASIIPRKETEEFNTVVLIDATASADPWEEVWCLGGGANKFSDIRQVQIFPNPAESTISFSNLLSINSIQFIDLVGQVVKSIEVSSEEITVNVDDLTPGTYFTRLMIDDGFVVKKIVVE